MSTQTTSPLAAMILPGLTRTLGLIEQLVADIPAERFARCPEGHADMNHPAFVIGHLSIYPDMLLEMLGSADQADPRNGYQELFSPTARCQDDPGGTIYPVKDELIAYITERYSALQDVLAGVRDEALLAEMPVERMRAAFPTVGVGTSFLAGPHLMFHLGQLSAWRRVEGLGPAMPHVGE